MDTALHILRLIHIPFGLLGLAVFWIPLVLKKGGLAHRRVGWVFVVCMGVASVTAAGLAVVRLLIGVRAEGSLTLSVLVGPFFLFNVAALTLTAVHHGVASLRDRARTERSRDVIAIALPALLVTLSLASLALGAITRVPVLFTLPIVGLFVGGQYLWTLLHRPADRMTWWYQHMSGMLGGCITAITAAAITNARHIRPFVPAPEWVFWITPALLGLPILFLWQRSYRLRFRRSQPA